MTPHYVLFNNGSPGTINVTQSTGTASTLSAGQVQLSGNVIFNVAPGAQFNVSSVLTDNNFTGGVYQTQGSLTKNGGGTLTLTGSSTYSGGTTISAGTLQIGAGGAAGSLAGNIVDNAALTYNRSDNFTYAGNISGSGSVTQVGAGTLTLAGTNSYSGVTTLTAGTLQFAKPSALYGSSTASLGANVNAAHLIVPGGSMMAFNVGGPSEFSVAEFVTVAGLGTAAGGFQSGSAIGIDTTNAGVNGVTISTTFGNPNGGANVLGLTKLGTGTLTLSGSFSYSGPTTVQSGTLQFNSGVNLNGGINVGAGALLVVAPNGTTNIGAHTLAVDGTNVSPAVANLAYDFSAGHATVGSNGAGTLNQTAGTTVLGDSSDVSTGNLLLGNQAGSIGTYNFSGSSILSANYFIVGKNGAGTFNQNAGPSAINYFVYGLSVGVGAGSSGTFNLNGGPLYAGGNITGGSGASVFNFNGGTLAPYSTDMVSPIVMSGLTAVNVQASGAIIDTSALSQTSNLTIAQNLAHDPTAGAPPIDGGLTISGGGVVQLLGVNTYTGGTRFQGGTLVLAKAAGMPATGTMAFSAGTTLLINLGGPGEWTGAASGAGSLGGLLSGIGGQGAPVTFAGALSLGLDTTNATSGSVTYAGNITNLNGGSNTLSLIKLGPGALNLTGSNSYTGGTAINGGVVSLGSAGALGSSGTLSFGGGTLQFTAANQTDYSPRFSTAGNQVMGFDTNGYDITFASGITSQGGSLTKNGAGALTIASGTLQNVALNAGTLNAPMTITSQLTIAGPNGSSATVNVTAASAIGSGAAADSVYVGYNGTGTLNQSGGSVNAKLYVGYNSGSSGAYTLTGGSVEAPSSNTGLGASGSVAYQAGSTGSFTMNGGTVTEHGFLIVGDGGTGVFNQSSGTHTGALILGHQGGSNGTYNLTYPSGSNALPALSCGTEIVGSAGIGTFNQTEGVNNAGALYIGGYTLDPQTGVGHGTYNLSNPLGHHPEFGDGSKAVWLAVSSDEILGSNPGSTGAFTQTGGVHSIEGSLYLGGPQFGADFATLGTYFLNGHAFSEFNFDATLLVRNNEYIGYAGLGTFTQTGGGNGGNAAIDGGQYLGGINPYAPNIYLGYQPGAIGTYNLSGGRILATKLIVGYNGTGTFTQSGGAVSTGNIALGNNLAGSSGTYNFDGGTLQLNSFLTGGSGSSTFNFNGGTFLSSGTGFTGVQALNVRAGGAIFDLPQGAPFTFDYGEGLLHDPTPNAPAIDGGLTLRGSGILALNGFNSYTGPTLIQGGRLVLHGAISGTVTLTVAIGGELEIIGGFSGPGGVSAVNGVTVASGGRLDSRLGYISGGLGGIVIQSGATFHLGNYDPGIIADPTRVVGPETAPSPGACTLNLQSGSTLVMDARVGPFSSVLASTIYLTGTLDVTGSNLQLQVPTPYGGDFPAGTEIPLIDNDGTDPVLGTFAQGSYVTSSSGEIFSISYTGGDGNDIVVTAVPEPGSLATLLGASALLLGCPRIRRRLAAGPCGIAGSWITS